LLAVALPEADVESDSSAAAGISVEIDSGVRLRLSADFDAASFSRGVAALRHAGG